ncbi:uncharacterized protein LOC110251976 [Exaiptasia diaphana]|uniref:CCHC-type domain-containing protein n=1 Tax=Exaiptasia diaphana TaxID=2652724 RepID=A0A913YUK9_EXADI|nr:uncharacterized protein LOC110251976 [Exaiptasia diaphana]
MITSKLPKDVVVQLEIQKKRDETWTVTKLLEQLEGYINARESAERIFNPPTLTTPLSGPHINSTTRDIPRNGCSNASLNFNFPPPKKPIFASETLLHAQKASSSPSRPRKACVYCNKEHWSDECNVYKTVEERKAKIKGRCYNCLSNKHMLRECQMEKACYYCKKKKNHHRSLCPTTFSSKGHKEVIAIASEDTHFTTNSDAQAPVNTECATLAPENSVVMQTATATVTNPCEESTQETAQILLDSGSYRSYITTDLAMKLKLQLGKKEKIRLVTFGQTQSQVINTPTTNLDLPLKDGTTLHLTVNVVPKITGEVHRHPISSQALNSHLLKDIELADKLPLERQTSNIDLLIGNDYYLDIIEPMRVQLQPGLYLLASGLGWILTGRTSSENVS